MSESSFIHSAEFERSACFFVFVFLFLHEISLSSGRTCLAIIAGLFTQSVTCVNYIVTDYQCLLPYSP